jgi:hypothetical protein
MRQMFIHSARGMKSIHTHQTANWECFLWLTPMDHRQQGGCHFRYPQTQAASLIFEGHPTNRPD